MNDSRIGADRADLKPLLKLIAKRLHDVHRLGSAAKRFELSLAATNRWRPATAELNVDVDLGRGVNARLIHAWRPGTNRDGDELDRAASEIAGGIADLIGRAPEIRAIATEVTAATRREIAKANRRGSDCAFKSAGIVPTKVGSDDPVRVLVAIEAPGSSRAIEHIWFEANCAADAVSEFAAILGQHHQAPGNGPPDRS